MNKVAIPVCPFCKTMLVSVPREWRNFDGSGGAGMGWWCPMPLGLEHDRYPEPEWVYVEVVKG